MIYDNPKSFEYDFKNTTQLREIKIISDVTPMPPFKEGMFQGCCSLTTISLEPATIEIPKDCFKDCIALKTIDLAFISDIGATAFAGCRSLTKLSLTEIKKMDEAAFDQSSITELKTKRPTSCQPGKYPWGGPKEVNGRYI